MRPFAAQLTQHVYAGAKGSLIGAFDGASDRISRLMRFILIAILSTHGWCCTNAQADGGRLRTMKQIGDYQVTVFTSPNPLRVGPIDISVFVQDRHTGQLITNVVTLVTLEQSGDLGLPILAVATKSAATNKLLQAAKVDVPAPGQWNVCVQCSRPGKTVESDHRSALRFAMDVAPPLPEWLSIWPWFMWPFIAVLLFTVHRKLSSVADK